MKYKKHITSRLNRACKCGTHSDQAKQPAWPFTSALVLKKDKMKKMLTNPSSIVLLGSAIAIFGSFIAAYGAYLTSVQNEKDSKHLLSSLTGGDSYPLIISGGENFFISIVGKYPLHEVQGKIVDVASMREQQEEFGFIHDEVPKTQYFEIGTLSPAYGFDLINRNTNRHINLKQFKARKCYRFIISLYTRHHTFSFRLALEPNEKENRWHLAWQVFRDQEKAPIAESIPEEFPLNSDLEVDFLLMTWLEEINTNK